MKSILVISMLFIIVVKQCYADDPPTPTQQTIEAIEAPSLNFTNHSSQLIKLTLRYKDSFGKWVMGSWDIDDDRESLLDAVDISDDEEVKSNYTHFYYHAETIKGSKIIWEGEHDWEFNGEVLPMIKEEILIDEDGEWVFSIRSPYGIR